MTPLSELEVWVVDCQATAARGHLLELGWARLSPGEAPVMATSRLIRLPAGERIPPGVTRVTGIDAGLLRDGRTAGAVWAELQAEAARLGRPRLPALAHFARFERPFLEALAQVEPSPVELELLCTHELARRLFPQLPRRSLRALAGYLGQALGPLRRSREHVLATAFVWRRLVPLLEAEGVTTLEALRTFLAQPVAPGGRAKKAWPMPRALRLGLPDAPGVYRMLRTTGEVLYVGKATSLKHRVNSYFRKQRGIHERTLEMLTQARDLSFVVTESPLEAALLEADEIKHHRPPYNVALLEKDRRLWFASVDLSRWSAHPAPELTAGPFAGDELLSRLAALARGDPEALGARWGPPPEVFRAARARFLAAHRELDDDGASLARLLRLGGRLWREGRRERAEPEETPGDWCETPTEPERRDASRTRKWPAGIRVGISRDSDDARRSGSAFRRPSAFHTSHLEAVEARWTPELAMSELEWLAVRAALAVRRARWLTRLSESSMCWSEPGLEGPRCLTVEAGAPSRAMTVDSLREPPVPPGASRTSEERRAAFTVASFDRLRVLSTELKRLVGGGAAVRLRLGTAGPWDTARLARVLDWL